MTFVLTEEIKNRLNDTLSKGLVSGLGNPVPGEMCVEAAVCFALGEPHSDKPSCVHSVDRSFLMNLNDTSWSSNLARANALAPLAFAQLGTVGLDRLLWVERVVVGTINRVLPIALRAIGLEDHALTCESAQSLKEADAAYAAHAAAYDTDADAADADAAATYAAHAAAYAARADATGDRVLLEAVAVALDAYRAEGRA
jgi:hypothetical protein